MAKDIDNDLQLMAALRDLSVAVKDLPRTKEGKIRRVPIALQERIIDVKERWSLGHDPLGKRIGITGTSIRYWWKLRRHRRDGGGFKAVQVLPERKASAPSPSSGLALELPGGARITGLTIADVRGLMAEGSRQ
jgi:hypothetical protein